MFVLNFEAMRHLTLVLLPEHPPRKFGVKSGLIHKRHKIFHMIICLKTSIHPYQPTFGHDKLFFFLI